MESSSLLALKAENYITDEFEWPCQEPPIKWQKTEIKWNFIQHRQQAQARARSMTWTNSADLSVSKLPQHGFRFEHQML